MPSEYRFDVEEFFPRRVLDLITEIRVNSPEVINTEAATRRKRSKLTRDGKLSILAFDHPGRGVTHSGSNPSIMGNRQEYLGRILRIATNLAFDGLMGTPDLLEDLFIVNYLVKQGGGPSFLDDRVLIGCMQRGGIAGVVGEIDDRFSAYTPEALAAQRLDGGKMMFRFVPDDEGTLKTIDYCSRAVTALHRRGLHAFVEPLPQVKAEGGYKGNADASLLIKLVSVCSALGESSQHTWLKIPYVEGYEQVALATTLPIVMLGGEALSGISPVLRSFQAGLRAGSNVRGVMVGRNLLFPGNDDPLAVALAVDRIIHQGCAADRALREMVGDRGKDMDAITKWVR